MFEVGQWVRTEEYNGTWSARKYDTTQDFADGWYKTVEKWIPTDEELCVFSNDTDYQLITNFKNASMCDDSYVIKHNNIIISYKTCEPYKCN